MTHGRGPNDGEIALRRFSVALLGLRELEPVLLKAVDELIEAQKKLSSAGIAEIEVRFGRELQTLINVRRGEAFWDRDAPDPTPAVLTR